MDERECPLCNEIMRIVEREEVDRIPGSPQVVKREVREWVCSECDYFEEVDETSGSAATERPT